MTERDPATVSEHPGPEEIAAYLSGGLGREERESVEAHLARCRLCRRQVTAAQALLRSRPRPARWVLVAAAAALAIALIGPWSFRGGRGTAPSLDIERARPSEALAIPIVKPADGDTILPRDVVFTWRHVGGDVLYRLSITDERGLSIWTTDTPDTLVSLSPNVHLTPGARYFWYVDALGANAASRTTGTHAFLVAP